MTISTLIRYVLFFGLGYTLSVAVIHVSGVDRVLSRGRPVQHVESNSPPEMEDGNQSFPQHAQRKGKNHEVIREAFVGTAGDAQRATVTLLEGDRQLALGTVVSPDGWVVTKSSELPGDEVECLLPNGVRTKAHRVSMDSAHDLALLRLVKHDGAVAAPWSSQSHAIPVGSLVVSTGSARTPLAIGVVSVPLIEIKRQPGVLGINMGQGRVGPMVTRILPGGAAEDSELQVEDLILYVDKTRVHTVRELSEAIREFWPGDQVDLTVQRDGNELHVKVRLGRKDDLDLENRDFQHELGGPLSTRRSGFGQVIQHDMVLTPQQCGGPLVDVEGQVIGINIARAERVATYALPAHIVRDLVSEMITKTQATIPANTTRAKP